MMMMVHHDDNRGRPEQRCDGGDGPTCTAEPPPLPPPPSSSTTRALQPFQYLSNTNTTALRSPGSGGMTTTTTSTGALGFPFTNQQWKELERQAMIYKYMMASLPVPRELLFPSTTTSPSLLPMCGSSSSNVVGFNLRLSNSTDPEPGRCKRTDGKKWRCSRDVAPDQKYCERHMHRGRPRSRKHVEIHAATAAATTAKKARRENNGTTMNNSGTNNNGNSQMLSPPGGQFFGSTALQSLHHQSSSPFGDVSSVSSNREARSLEWMMKSESAAPMNQWQDLMQSKTVMSCSRIPYFDAANSSSVVFGQRSEEEESFLNLNTYHHQQQHQESNDINLFLSPELENPLLEEAPRSFIDAWSSKNDNGDNNARSLPSSGQLSPSSLTLSMGGYNSISEEMGQKTQMSLGCDNGNGSGIKPQLSAATWLTPASWVSSPPGGPLAEVLKPTNSAASTPSSPMTANHGEFSSSPLGGTTTNVSSPSGVLQKTFANSFSDNSSGNSSPSLTSSKAKTEIGSLWLNQSKA